jgi:Protein of unknown function (DUF1587)/Protein of unknown function (DUF1592)
MTPWFLILADRESGSFTNLTTIGKCLTSVRSQQKTWERVREYVEGGVMPPEERPQPSREEAARLTQWIKSALKPEECGRTFDPGRVTIRRLNRAEFNNTIRDLIGIDFHPADDFPSDDVGYGFDNIGDVLTMPPILMEKYLAAAEAVSEEAIVVEASAKGSIKRYTSASLGTDSGGSPRGDGTLGLASEGEITVIHAFPRNVRVELDSRGKKITGKAGAAPAVGQSIGDFELASRISYFLWSSMPDDELWRLTVDGSLRSPEVLDKHVRRMLRDPPPPPFKGGAYALATLYPIRSVIGSTPSTARFNPARFNRFAPSTPGPRLCCCAPHTSSPIARMSAKALLC